MKFCYIIFVRIYITHRCTFFVRWKRKCILVAEHVVFLIITVESQIFVMDACWTSENYESIWIIEYKEGVWYFWYPNENNRQHLCQCIWYMFYYVIYFVMYVLYVIYLITLLLYSHIYFINREREREWGGGRERLKRTCGKIK